MIILVACDKFKDSISAEQAVNAITNGLMEKYPYASIIQLPMADGGDGSLDIIQKYLPGKMISVATQNALGESITAEYFIHNQTAYIELTSASGLAQLPADQRNPTNTSTYGTGLLFKNAVEKGAKKIVLMLGGSSTNDAGLGIAEALGFNFYNSQNELLFPIGKNLVKIDKITGPTAPIDFALEMYCDVTNPLHGPNGATHVFAKQKGANNEDIELLEAGLINVASKIDQYSGKEISNISGGGAAGGIAAGLYGLLDGKIKNGFDAISKITNIEEKIKEADLVISGEGKLDTQSLHGKVVGEIAKLCDKYSKKHIVFVGKNVLTPSQIKQHKIHKVYEILSLANEEEAMKNAQNYLTQLASSIR